MAANSGGMMNCCLVVVVSHMRIKIMFIHWCLAKTKMSVKCRNTKTVPSKISFKEIKIPLSFKNVT